MANRRQRLARAETKRLERVRDRLVGEGVKERSERVQQNLATPKQRNYYAGITSSVVLCERMGSRSGGIPKIRTQKRVDGRWQ